jgi:hypothetical protein
MDIEKIRVRIMSEAYDLADRGDLEGYNAIKMMCGEILESIAAAVAAEREACAQIAKDWDASHPHTNYGACIANAIRAKGNT